MSDGMKRCRILLLLALGFLSLFTVQASSGYAVFLPAVSRTEPTPTATMTPLPTPTPWPTVDPAVTLICEQLIQNASFEQGSDRWHLQNAGVVTGWHDWPQGDSGLVMTTGDPLFPEGQSLALQPPTESEGIVIPADAKAASLSYWHKYERGQSEGRHDWLNVGITRPGIGRHPYYSWFYSEGCGYHASTCEYFCESWCRTEWDVSLLAGREINQVAFWFYNDDEGLSTLYVDGVELWVCR